MIAALLLALPGPLTPGPALAMDALAGSGPTLAHRFHVSLAQADYNPKSGSLEVALRVNAFDLEQALSRAQGVQVDLDRTPGIDELIESYLSERITLSAPDGRRAAFEWVGKEDFTLELWLYFELRVAARTPPRELKGHTLSNRIFFELHPEQTNSVTYGRGRTRRSLRFTADQRRIEL